MSWPQAGRALLQSQLSAQAPNRSSHLPLVLAAAGGAAAALLISYGCRRVVKGVQAAPVPVLLDACEPCAEEEAAADVVGMSTPTGAKTPQAPTPRQAMLGASTDCYLGLSKDNESVRRRDNYIPWHDYFMSVAMLSAFRSKDPNRQVGACIVDPRTLRIVGIGYNGFPWNCSDDALPWARDADQWLDTKYPYVCHAEMNAILNKNCSDLEGMRIYTTLFPCNECAKLIVQSRIKEVVYLSDAQAHKDPFKASRRILDLAGVASWQHKPFAPRIVVDFEDDLARVRKKAK